MEQLPLRHDARAQQQEHERRRVRQLRAVKILAAIAVVALLSWLVIAKWVHRATTPPYVADFERAVREYKAQNGSAVVAVSINGKPAFTDAVGLASEELSVPLSPSSLFPIGSNSKLFVSVALYQLQERGLVNLSHAINDVLGPDDFANFGFPNQTRWCPRLAHASPTSPCENVTYVQLLYMGSGIGDALNCDNVAPEDCHQSANDVAIYHGSIGAHVGSFINAPLAFTPGTNYSYANPNFVLASYLVEKISGESLETYMQTHIFDKVGLTETVYDPYSGLFHVQRNYVEQYVDYYVAREDNASGTFTPTEYLATGTCSPYMNSGAVSGAGGLRSTVGDMHKWFTDLFHNHGRSSKVLTEASIRAIVHTRNPISRGYAQGVGVTYVDGDDNWPSRLDYTGGVKCALTSIQMSIASPSDSVVVTAFSNHEVLYFPSRAAFEAWRPTEFLFMVHPGVVGIGMGVFSLRDALVKAVWPSRQ